jgi:LysR family transcriptional regulator, transcriptional activator of nhaA
MEWLNYHHLHYFWVVAREGSLVAAGKVLRLSHPTLSAQVKALEARLGTPLFLRTGRRLELTEAGRLVFRYAEEIFSLGRELLGAVQGGAAGQPLRLNIGVCDAVPKQLVRRLIEPALALPEPVRIVCHEDDHDQLLAGLALHTFDVVISDCPVAPGSPVRAFHHMLGETGVTFLGTRSLVRAYKSGFPASLDQAPMLLPIAEHSLRRALNHWLERHGAAPHIVAEVEDSALLKVLGADGLGIFVAPTAIEADVIEQYGVQVLGRAPDLRERFYAISIERKLKNAAVVALMESARKGLFAKRSHK